MVKTPKNTKKKKNNFQKSQKRKNSRKKTKNITKTPYQRYINAIPKIRNRKERFINIADIYIIKIKYIFELLYNYFSKNTQISAQSLNNLLIITQSASDQLFANFENLLTPEEFYKSFCSYLKKIIKENQLNKMYNSTFAFRFFNLFKRLMTKNLNEYLFDDSIASFIRQDIILSIFHYGKQLDNYIVMFDKDNDWYAPIDKNNLIIDESVETFKQEYLYSETTFNAIKLTLAEFIQVDDEKIKNTINEILDKTKFYYSDLDEQYSGISFLGYNVVIRNYFKDFNDKDIKVVLRNVITHEIIHLLLLELTDKNFFNNSFEKSNKKISESGEHFEKIFFGVDVKWYSKELCSYLKNFQNYEKNLQECNKDIIDIYNKTCKQKENVIQYLTDAECIQQNILRHKMNFKNYVVDKQFGYCYKHFLIKENNY